MINFLAQQGGRDWGNLLYLLIFLVIPALNALGEWIRKRSAKKEEQEEGSPTELEIVDEEDGWLVVKPQDKPPTARAPKARPAAKPVAVAKPATTPTATPLHVASPQAQPTHRTQRQPLTSQLALKPAPTARPKHRRAAKPARIRAHSVFSEAELRENDEQDTATPAADHVLAGEKLDAKSLRKAIVLNEILGPPLALRRHAGASFFDSGQ